MNTKATIWVGKEYVDGKGFYLEVNVVFEGSNNPMDDHKIVGVEVRGEDDKLLVAVGEECDTKVEYRG